MNTIKLFINNLKVNVGFILVFTYLVVIYVLNFTEAVLYISKSDLLSQSGFDVFKFYIATCSAFVTIALLLWMNIDRLEEHNLERSSLLLLALSGLLVRVKPHIQHEDIYRGIISLASVVILIAVFHRREKIPRTNIRLAFPEFLLLLPISGLSIIAEAFQPQHMQVMSLSVIVGDAISRLIFYRTAFAAIEEVMVRGLLWGYLRRFGWGETKVFWIQAFIFWMAHFLKISYAPITFLVTIPISTLLLSILVKKTGQVFSAIVAHAFFNAVVTVTIQLIFSLTLF